MNHLILSQEELNEFIKIKEKILSKRINTYDKRIIFDEITTVNPEKNKKIYEIIQPIKSKSIEILESLKITNYDKNIYAIEFHQRNSGFEKKPYELFAWHKDDYEVLGHPVYTILFYLRKDETIKGGNLQYFLKTKNEKIRHIHIVNVGDILCFKGNISHYPEPTSGFGCRDLISVFIKRD